MSSPLSQSTRSDMRSAAGWAKFVGVVLVIMAALVLIFGLMGSAASPKGSGIFVLLFLVVGGVAGTMGYLLILYSNNLQEAAEQGKLKPLEMGFTKLKSYFIIAGIIAILSACVSLYQLTL